MNDVVDGNDEILVVIDIVDGNMGRIVMFLIELYVKIVVNVLILILLGDDNTFIFPNDILNIIHV